MSVVRRSRPPGTAELSSAQFLIWLVGISSCVLGRDLGRLCREIIGMIEGKLDGKYPDVCCTCVGQSA